MTPDVMRREPGPRAGVVVERARRQAGRDRHALEQPGADVRDALRDRLLVDVDLVAVLGGERAGVAGGLREADQHQRDRGDRHRDRRGPTSGRGRGRRTTAARAARRRRARRRGRRGRTATRPAARRPPARAPRAPAGRPARSPNTTTSATTPTTTVAGCVSPSVAEPRPQLLQRVGARRPSVPVSLGSSPMTTSIAAPNRKPVTTARDRNCAIQPIFSTASTRKSSPDASVMPATNDATSCLVGDPGGDHGARRDRRQPRARSHRDLPAGAEDRVEDRAGRRRVEAVLQRDPGDPGVAEVLRDDQRGDRDARRSGRRAASAGRRSAASRRWGSQPVPVVRPVMRSSSLPSGPRARLLGDGWALACRLTVPMIAAGGAASRIRAGFAPRLRPRPAPPRPEVPARRAPPAGLEPATKRLEGSCSIR